MNANQDPTRRDDLLVMLLHGGAATNSIARSVVDHHAAEVRAEQAAEIDRLRAELASYKDHLDHLERHTLPQLHREIQHHQDGKERWRDRAEKAEARVAELERPAIEAERAEIRQSFMELSAQAREDRDFEGAFNVDCNLREREEQWKREDAAKADARGSARLDASAAAQAEATHWRRLGMTPPADSQNLQTGGER